MPRVEQTGTPQTYVPADIAQAQPLTQQQGMPQVPDRLHAIAALTEWDCFSSVIESITSFFNYLIETCSACFTQIGVALGCITPVNPAQATISRMVDRWVTPYRTKAAEARVREAEQTAKEQAAIRKLALQLAAQEQNARPFEKYTAEAAQTISNRRDREIVDIAKNEARNAFKSQEAAFKCKEIAKLLATKAGHPDEDLTPYMQEEERI